MRFRISTLLLVIALGAVLLAWHLEKTDSRNEIAGVWYYPTPDINLMGYWETLTIRKDGTFTKFEQHRMSSETYAGTYTLGNDGVYYFDVTQKTISNGDEFKLAKQYRCRCALDHRGYLIIHSVNFDFGSDSGVGFPQDCYLKWHCYCPHSHDEQRNMESEKIKALIERLKDAG